ncbi:hypothetical protein ACHAWF_001091 [Thalassiosira exigua]
MAKSHVLYDNIKNGKAREIVVGSMLSCGVNLPSSLNFADYFGDKSSLFNVLKLKFFADHRGKFPTLWTLVQCKATICKVKVGCACFFSLSGCISAPRPTRLGVRTYEHMALLASNLPKIYVESQSGP